MSEAIENYNKKTNFYKGFKQITDPNYKNDIELVRAKMINSPIIQTPAFTSTSTLTKMKNNPNFNNYGLNYDFITSEFYLLKELLKNKWVQRTCHTVANSVVNCEPFFNIFSENSVIKSDGYTINRYRKILLNPNRNETWYKLIYKTAYALHLSGVAYIQVVKSRFGDLHSLYSVPPETIRPVAYIDSNTGELRYVFVQVFSANGITFDVKRVFTDEEIIFFRTPNIFTLNYGTTAYASLFDNLKFDTETQVYLNNYMENTFSGGMIFELKDASPEVVERNREELVECLSGAKNAGRNMILEGSLRLVNDGNKTKDFPIEQLRTVNIDDILVCSKVPVSMLGKRTSHGTINAEMIEQEQQVFYRDVVRFLQKIIFGDLNLQLFNNILNKEIILEEGVNKDFITKSAEQKALTVMKVGATINEVRKTVGYSKLENEELGQKVIIATNNGVIDAVDHFSNMSKEGKKKDLEIKQMKQNLNNNKQDNNIDSSTDDGSIPSLNVSTKESTVEVE